MDRERFEMRVGAFVFAGLAMLGAIVTVLGAKQDLFARQYVLYADFEDVAGLKPGATIRLSGVDIGEVGNIAFPERSGETKLRVRLQIRSSVQNRIRADSIAAISTQGVLGDKYIAITLGSTGAPLAANAVLTSERPVDYSEIVATAGKTIDHLNSITGKVDDMLSTGTSDATRKGAETIVGSVAAILHEVQTGGGLLHRLIYDKDSAKLLQNVADASENVSALTHDARTGDGFISALLHDPKQRDAFEHLTASADDLHASARELKAILGRVDRGEGTLGALINDSGAYDDLRALLGKAKRNRLLRVVVRHAIDKNEKIPALDPEEEPAKDNDTPP